MSQETATAAVRIDIPLSLGNLLRLAADTLIDGAYGTRVTVNAYDLAEVFREAAAGYAELSDRTTPDDDERVIAAAAGADPVLRIASDLVDREPGTP